MARRKSTPANPTPTSSEDGENLSIQEVTEVAPEVAPEVTPEVVAEVAPEVAPEGALEVAPDKANVEIIREENLKEPEKTIEVTSARKAPVKELSTFKSPLKKPKSLSSREPQGERHHKNKLKFVR